MLQVGAVDSTPAPNSSSTVDPPRVANQGVAAVVLAGGRSSRFGSDKSRAEFAGTPVLERVLRSVDALRRLHLIDEVVVVGTWAPDGVRHELEPVRFLGPLAGLEHGLATTRGDVVLALAGDHPLLASDLLELLVERALSTPEVDAVVPVGPDGPEPLVACYRRSVHPVVVRHLEQGRRSVRGLLDVLTVEWVGRRVWSRVDRTGASFLDIDTPEDLAAFDRAGSAPEG